MRMAVGRSNWILGYLDIHCQLYAAVLEVKTAFRGYRVPMFCYCLCGFFFRSFFFFILFFDSQNVKPDQTANEHFIEII